MPWTSRFRYACSSGKLRTQPPSVAITPSTLTGSTSPLTAAEARIARPIVSGARRARRVRELEVPRLVRLVVVADVGREDEELDVRGRERLSDLQRVADRRSIVAGRV